MPHAGLWRAVRPLPPVLRVPAANCLRPPAPRLPLSLSLPSPPRLPARPQPCYKWWEPPYFWAGLRMYDLIAGAQGLEWCRYLTPSQALSRFPTLCSHRKGDGSSLKGAIVYHDGQARRGGGSNTGRRRGGCGEHGRPASWQVSHWQQPWLKAVSPCHPLFALHAVQRQPPCRGVGLHGGGGRSRSAQPRGSGQASQGVWCGGWCSCSLARLFRPGLQQHARRSGCVSRHHTTCPPCPHLSPKPQDDEGRVVGASVQDGLSGRKQDVYARTVVNAAGPFSDEVRSLSQARRRGRAWDAGAWSAVSALLVHAAALMPQEMLGSSGGLPAHLSAPSLPPLFCCCRCCSRPPPR